MTSKTSPFSITHWHSTPASQPLDPPHIVNPELSPTIDHFPTLSAPNLAGTVRTETADMYAETGTRTMSCETWVGRMSNGLLQMNGMIRPRWGGKLTSCCAWPLMYFRPGMPNRITPMHVAKTEGTGLRHVSDRPLIPDSAAVEGTGWVRLGSGVACCISYFQLPDCQPGWMLGMAGLFHSKG